MITWETYDATRAFERSRRMAFARLAKTAILGGKPGLRYSGLLPREEYSLEIGDIEMLDAEGTAIRLPALPLSQKATWLKEYKRFAETEASRDSFSTRLEGGRLVLEGGIAELRRLELLRAFGESLVAARMSPGPERAADVIEYPMRLDAACCPDRAAS